MHNLKAKNVDRCSNNKAGYFLSLLFGGRGEGRKAEWNRVKKKILK